MGDLQQPLDPILLGPIPHFPHDLEANLNALEGNGHGEIHAVPKIGRQKLWPNAEESLGDKCESLASPQGRFQCWQIVGDASERTRELQNEIRQVLEEYSDEIHKGGGVQEPVVATIFMIGKTEKTACPALIICGQKKRCKTARGKIRDSKLLDNFRKKHGLKVMMAQRDEMPLGNVQRVSGPRNTSRRLSVTVPANLEISYHTRADIQDVSAVQLYIKFGQQEDQTESKATVGCLLSSDGKYFAWTAAHPFFDLPDFSDDSNSTRSSDLGFTFDSEYGYETDDQESDVPLTGTSQNHSTTQPHLVVAATSESETELRNLSAIPVKHLGTLYQTSFASNSSADWALIEINEENFKTVTSIINGAHRQVYLDPIPPQKEVSLITARGSFEGSLSCSPVFISIPPSPQFQELWIVRLKNGMKIKNGDCGSLVVDSKGIIYGHLISGDISRGICHIVPAAQTFEEMKSRGNRNLTLAERPPATLNPSPIHTSNTLVGSFRINASDPGPTFAALDEAIESDGDDVARISSVPATRTDDLGQRIRSRFGKKQPSKEAMTPGFSQRDRSPLKPRRFLKPLHFWIDPMHIVDLISSNPANLKKTIAIIDQHGFDWHIFLIAGAGLFGASYALTATAIIMPSLAFIYWPEQSSSAHAIQIRSVSLTGVVVGAIISGHFADRYGRRKIYGFGLFTLLIGILGSAQASAGFDNAAMSFLGWFLFWQFLLGFGVGETITSTAILISEFAPTSLRGRMMAAVFLMQPLGQLAATLVSLIVVHTYGLDRGLREQKDRARAATITDSMWRLVVGFGGIPLLLALPLRLTIPEPFRYILGDLKTSRPKRRRIQIPEITNRYYEDRQPDSTEHPREMVQLQRLSGGLFETNSHGTSGSQAEVAQADTDHYRLNDSRYLSHPDDPELLGQYQPDEPEPESAEPHLSFSTDEIHKYFWVEGNWRYLAGISLCGFFLHTAFAVLGTYDYRVIFQIWDSATPPSNSTSLPAYSNGQSVSLVPGTEIYNVLSNSATNSLITVSVPLVVGSMLALIMVDHIPRRKALAWTSLVFALLLIVAGIVIIRDSKTSRSLVITLYVLLQFVFNFVPNLMLFMIAAEIFPTRYRSTCYGITFAVGTVGTIVGELLLNNKSLHIRGYLIVGFSTFPVLAALFAWAWLPDIQTRYSRDELDEEVDDIGDFRSKLKLSNKPLEQLGMGMLRMKESGEEEPRFRKRFLALTRG